MSDLTKTVMTGGSGLLGSAVVDLLRLRGLVCLTRRTPVDGVPNVTVDLTDDRLGLTTEAYDRLLEGTEVVLHSAALTGFRVTREDAMATNRDGTGNLLKLAERSGARFVHVSSAFVARRVHAPADRPAGQPSPWNYLDSKQAAEELVGASAAPSVIVRPSVVIGDSATGKANAQQGFHTMLEAVCNGLLPIIPFEAETAVDFVPQDIVAEAIAGIVADPSVTGERWLTSGPDALTVEAVVLACLGIMAETGRAPRKPRFVAPETVDRLILPTFSSVIPPKLLRKFLGLVAMGRLFGPDREPFPTSLSAMIGDAPRGKVMLEALESNIRYSWGTPAAPRVREGSA